MALQQLAPSLHPSRACFELNMAVKQGESPTNQGRRVGFIDYKSKSKESDLMLRRQATWQRR